MATNECHNASVVKAIYCHLLLLAISHFIQGFALVDCFIRHGHIALLWRSLACSIDPSPNIVDLWLGNKINRIIKRQAVTRRTSVPMVKRLIKIIKYFIAVHGNTNVSTVIQRSPEVLTTKARRTSLC